MLLPRTRRSTPRRQGFTLIELVIAISLIALLAGLALPAAQNQMAKSRDARRMSDLRTWQAAIERFRIDTGRFPAPGRPGPGGWDVSYDGDFIPELLAGKYVQDVLADPSQDNGYHYRYYRYNQGSFGCNGPSAFYVLGIVQFETDDARRRNHGAFKCAGHDWGADFEFVVGGGATYSAPGAPSGPGLVGH